MNIEELIKRIQYFKISCNLKTSFGIKQFHRGYEYVDLGLPSGTKWATMNVGATSETDYGLYFQWGDTQGYTASQVGIGEGKKYFGWADYKFNPSGEGETFTKYNATDGNTVLDLEDDAARANWGGSWKMPTEVQFQELLDNTKNELTTVDSVNGCKFTSKTDSSKYIFIPAAGSTNEDNMHGVGDYGIILSSSLYSNLVNGACGMLFSCDIIDVSGYYRYGGFSVRGVVG